MTRRREVTLGICELLRSLLLCGCRLMYFSVVLDASGHVDFLFSCTMCVSWCPLCQLLVPVCMHARTVLPLLLVVCTFCSCLGWIPLLRPPASGPHPQHLMFSVGADVGTSTLLGSGSPPPEECVDTGAKLVLWGISLLCI